MQIVCNRCNAFISSLLIDKQLAIRELYSKLEQHAVTEHKGEMMQMKIALGKAGMLFTTYFLVHSFALIPESESDFLNVHNKVIEQILKTMDIEVTEPEIKSTN
jgi:hypothetical protein